MNVVDVSFRYAIQHVYEELITCMKEIEKEFRYLKNLVHDMNQRIRMIFK